MTGMYAERAPAADLAGHLSCSWTRTTGGPGTVLPDGCLDLLWIAGELVVAGPDTVAARSELGRGIEIAAVRFRPGAAPAVLGLPASALRDQRVPLAELWPDATALAARVDAAADRVAVLEAAVRRRLADAPPADPVALAVAGRLSRWPTPPPAAAVAWPAPAPPGGGRTGGEAGAVAHRAPPPPAPGRDDGGSAADARPAPAPSGRGRDRWGVVAELAWRAGLSERQLHRRCLAAFGYGPKTLDRVLRLQRFLALGRADPGAGLARLAADAGYADQAHLGHDCRALAGATPGVLIA